MSIARVKVWGDEILTASDLNGEFNNIINNALALISPLTGTLDVDGNTITLDSDGDCTMSAATDDVISFVVGSGSMKIDLSTASIVNGFTWSATATGNPPIMAAQGTDSNIGVAIRGKGTGTVRVQNAAGTSDLFVFDAGTASGTNGVTMTSKATGTGPTVAATGGDTNIDLNLVTKGTGVLQYNGETLDDLINGDKYYQNDIINSNFAKWEPFGPTVTSTGGGNNDDAYFCNRWIVLSNGNDVVDLSRETSTVPDNSNSALLCDIETGNAKFGILQILEAKVSEKYESRRASLSFAARKTGSSFTAIRAGVLKWGSTGDSVTSDVVSAWNGAGSNPTLAANWSFCNTPAALTALTTSYQTYTIENIDIGSTCNNVAVFIWLDDVTTTVGEFLYIAEVQLTRTALAPVYHDPDPAIEDLRCARFYEKTFSPDVAPGNATDDSQGALCWSGTTANVPTAVWKFRSPKRVSPTVTMYNFRAAGTDGQWDNTAASMANARATDTNVYHVRIDNTSTVASASSQWFIHATADAEL